MTGHPVAVTKMAMSPDNKHLFTIGENDTTILMWTFNTSFIVENAKLGGIGLKPFCYSVPGAHSGWLFKEMQDLFYYFQILSQSDDLPEEQSINDFIPLTEVADFMRAIGFFPSEFEIKNMLNEVMRKTDKNLENSKISFEDLVRLYLNHKPCFGYNIKDIVNSVTYFINRSNKVVNKELLDRNQLMEICTQMGEPMGKLEAVKILHNLITNEDVIVEASANLPEDDQVHNMLYDLPEVFSIDDFTYDVLGLPNEMDKQLRNKVDKKDVEDNFDNEFED